MTDQEAAVGATAAPHPLGEADDDRWMWHWCGVVEHNTTIDGAGISATRVEIDSKAMRKWDSSQQLALIVENDALDGAAASVIASGFFRILLKG